MHSLTNYYSDMVFGDGPGVKATLDLGDLEGYSGRAARVVVALAKDDEATLREARGTEIKVEGVLHRCDAFMRVIYLSDGTLDPG